MAKQLHITLTRSVIGRTQVQRDTVRTLGLKKLNQTIIKQDNVATRGMINRVSHLIKVEEK